MEDLDKTIDSLASTKLTSLLQENGVRLTKISLRFTTSNKKNTVEYLNEIIGSYEKLLSVIPKGILSVEKSVRTKYRVLMDEDRRFLVMSNMGREMESIISQLVTKYRVEYVKKGQVESFDKRIENARSSIKNIDTHVHALMEELKSAFKEEVILPDELSRMYGIEEASLVNMQLIIPLQKMNATFKEMQKNTNLCPVVEGIQGSLICCVQVIQRLERGEGTDFVTPEARKSGKLLIAKSFLRFKDLAINIGSLLEQWVLVKEHRNAEIIQKTWERTQELFKGQVDGEIIVAKVKPLYELFEL